MVSLSRKFAAAVVALASSAPLRAAEPTLSFPSATVASTTLRSYICQEQQQLSVAYVATADGDAFAYLTAEGRPHIFISVASESGTKYVSGPYVWATKGTTGSLSRVDDAGAPPLLADCSMVPTAPARPRFGSEVR